MDEERSAELAVEGGTVPITLSSPRPNFLPQGRMPQLWSTVFISWHAPWMPGGAKGRGAHSHSKCAPTPNPCAPRLPSILNLRFWSWFAPTSLLGP